MRSYETSTWPTPQRPFGLRRPFTPEVVPPADRAEPAWWFAFHGTRLLIRTSGDAVDIPYVVDFAELGVTAVHYHYLGRLDGRPCYAVDLADDQLPGNLALQGLRQVYEHLDEDLFALGGRAVQIVEWDRNHRFCGRCGTRTHTRPHERAKECPHCGLLHFPRLSPAIIVLVERGQEVLLARSPRFAPGMYSVLAGFVEPGETLEETVAREVQEEVGITVRHVRYFASQPWPFPNSLMLGFTAEYAGGEIVLDDPEIEDAGWFTVDTLPGIPGRISIARRLIDWWLMKQHQGT